jgi:mannose-6-phosphate isomerase-like protein (cupin superfamily)
MTYFATFTPPDGTGFELVAGPPQGLSCLLVAGGRVPTGDPGHVHLHLGEEIIHVVSGQIAVRVGDERRTCGPGDLVVIPANTVHGFRVVRTAVLEVIAQQRMGTYFPVPQADGSVQLVEIHTPSPWNNPPPAGCSYTTEAEVRELVRQVGQSI